MHSALLFPSISLLMLSWVQRKGDTNLLIWNCLPIKTRAIIRKVHTYFIVHGHLEYYSGFGAAGMSKGPISTVARTSPGLLFSCNLSSCKNQKHQNHAITTWNCIIILINLGVFQEVLALLLADARNFWQYLSPNQRHNSAPPMFVQRESQYTTSILTMAEESQNNEAIIPKFRQGQRLRWCLCSHEEFHSWQQNRLSEDCCRW